VIADIFPPRQRGRALSGYFIGATMGTALSSVIPGWIVAADIHWHLPVFGVVEPWRVAFLVCGAIGPVIGLLPAWSYEQGSVTLQPGDVFVSFTDGISEAMNSEMEEWGEEQLIATVAPACEHPLDDLITRIMTGADMHTGTAPQHDDMTLVLARCV